MKVLLCFFLLCLAVGTLWESKLPRRYLLPVVGLSALVMVSYFYFNQS